MKKLFSLTVMLVFAATALFAQEGKVTMQHNVQPKKAPASPHETITGNGIKITYGRPYKKGREIFGGLEAYGKPWRTGADEATEITFDKDCMFVGRAVKAGTYTLTTIPGKFEFIIVLNKQLGQWGAFKYDEYKDKNVLEAAVAVKHLSSPVEQFTIKIENDGVRMEWDKSSWFAPVKY